ncbi:hypothetical protein [Aliikangiella sp. G2MR2-5]|uniref:hypothetical protein n=1 Tax=Aliikangiella sp. G2MR2-5 TaxID=2788943 RepID=UPI0018A8D8F9|nr:hypothetical protein [Aliikangiella sp. G2MR2-5]
MQKIILITMLLCVLSAQVLGSVAYENEQHSTQGDVHSLMHEVGQPHSHEHDDESQFTLSYSDEAFEHINEDSECCVVGLLEMSSANVSARDPSNAVSSIVTNWSPPFLQYIKPPPEN